MPDNSLRATKVATHESDPEVRSQRTRRAFTAVQREAMLAEYDACENAADRAAVIRKHAIYRSHLANWRKQLTNVDPPKKRGRRANPFSRVSSQISNRLARIAVASLHGTTPSIGICGSPCSRPRTSTAEEAKNADRSIAFATEPGLKSVDTFRRRKCGLRTKIRKGCDQAICR